MTISRVQIWIKATGGGLPVDYLRWLSALWEQYRHDALASATREGFDQWLVARFSGDPYAHR